LSQNEKRHFVMHTSSHKQDSNYIKLFHALDKQKYYNEEEIKHKFKGQKILTNLPVTKYNLRKLILKNLQVFRSGSTVESELKESFANAEILYTKGFYSQCAKDLVKIKTKATQYEKFNLLLEILGLERRVLTIETQSEQLRNKIKQNFDDERKTLEILQNASLFRERFIDFQYQLRTLGAIRQPEQLEVLTAIIQDPLFKNEKNAISTEANVCYLAIHAQYYRLTERHERSYQYLKSLVTRIENNSFYWKEDIFKYTSTLIDMGDVCKKLKRYDELREVLSKLKSIPSKSSHVKARIFEQSSELELSAYIHQGAFEEAVQAAHEVEQQLHQYGDMISAVGKLTLYYNISYALIGAGRFREALTWINEILNFRQLNLREDLHCFARILNFVIHYELNNTEQLPYIIQSTKRYLNTRNRLFKFETILLKFLDKQILDTVNTKKIKGSFTLLRDELSPLVSDPFESQAFEYFDFFSWLEAKITGKTMGEVMEKKYPPA